MVANINTYFTHALLVAVMKDVRPLTTAAQRKEVWTYHFNGDHWEFHGPDNFYWHGSADGGYDARYQGWCAWLASKGVEGYKLEDEPTIDSKGEAK